MGAGILINPQGRAFWGVQGFLLEKTIARGKPTIFKETSSEVLALNLRPVSTSMNVRLVSVSKS